MISFIVPAYNEARLLGATLAALRVAADKQAEAYELIVVDDASDDDTAAIATAAGARVVSVHRRQIAATRNAGARAALGRWFVFVDADTLVSGEVVSATLDAMRAGAVGGGAGVAFDGAVPWYSRWVLPALVALFRVARLAAGCYLYCTREAFEAVGGFDERYFGAEELVLSRALKTQGRFRVLRAQVVTSGRKLRQYSSREMLATLARLAWRGRRALQRREGLDIWYGPRRNDP